MLLNTISYDRMVQLSKDKKFMKQLNAVYADFRAYMDTPKDKNKPTVAYFSMEYGLSHVLKIYSGGLGILAGDSTCVGLRYGCIMNNSGFSRHTAHMLRYFCSLRITPLD